MNNPLLDVKDLSVGFRIRDSDVCVVENVDLSIDRGEVLGIIGESGSGKTVTCSAIYRLMPDNAWIHAKHVMFDGDDITNFSAAEFQPLRGSRMGMIFQDPVGAFNPVKKIGWHFRHVSRRVQDRRPELAEQGAWRREAMEVLRRVGIPHADGILENYPHQLSGGMLQRALIGLILQMKPSLIVADEPTTNLDNIVEWQIIALFKRLKEEIHGSLVFITHDMHLATEICDRIAVMYAGQIVEVGTRRQIMDDPKHPYTQGLVRTSRELQLRPKRLKEIPGELPHWQSMPSGCRFKPRCTEAMDGCEKAQTLRSMKDGRKIRCLLYDLETEPA